MFPVLLCFLSSSAEDFLQNQILQQSQNIQLQWPITFPDLPYQWTRHLKHSHIRFLLLVYFVKSCLVRPEHKWCQRWQTLQEILSSSLFLHLVHGDLSVPPVIVKLYKELHVTWLQVTVGACCSVFCDRNQKQMEKRLELMKINQQIFLPSASS